MVAPNYYWPQKGDVVLVRATISHITLPIDATGGSPGNRLASDSQGLTDEIKLTGRTDSDKLARFGIDDIEKVEIFELSEGSRVRWWSEDSAVTPGRWLYGKVLAVEPAEDEADRPHKDNLWIKNEATWPRITKRRHEVERA